MPDRIAIDKSGANLAGLQRLNVIQEFAGVGRIVGVVQSKYRNNIVEQDHRFIKRIPRPMLGFKAFRSAAATLAGIETAHMIRKGQFDQTGVSACKQFAALAAELCPSKTVLQPSENFATEPLLADRTFDADWLRKDLMDRDIVPVIPPKANRTFPAEFDKETYKWRHLIENYFGKQKGSDAPMQDRPELQSLRLYRGDNPTITMNVNSP